MRFNEQYRGLLTWSHDDYMRYIQTPQDIRGIRYIHDQRARRLGEIRAVSFQTPLGDHRNVWGRDYAQTIIMADFTPNLPTS
jgi:hypothetical protein